MKRLLSICLILASLSGCATRSFKDGHGVEYSSTIFLVKESIASLSIPTDKGNVTVTGFKSDQAEIAGAIVSEAVKAAIAAAAAQQAQIQAQYHPRQVNGETRAVAPDR